MKKSMKLFRKNFQNFNICFEKNFKRPLAEILGYIETKVYLSL